MKASFKDRDLGWKRIKKEMKAMKGAYVEVGVLSGAGAYNDPEGGGSVNMADIATFNEFGTANIPPRPFMKTAFDENEKAIENFKRKQRDLIYQGKQTTRGALTMLGEFFLSKVQRVFDQSKKFFEPNAESTIKAKTRSGKKGDTPLIDTGQLRQSITYEVKMKNG